MTILFVLALLFPLTACRRTTPRPDVPEAPSEEVSEERPDFIPAIGANRTEVEENLGSPEHEGRTKEGHQAAHYRVAGPRFRSIVYDQQDQVLSVYPPGGFDELQTAPYEIEPFNPGQPRGALTGASVFLSPGHGWFQSSRGNWTTQRGVSHGIIEDHSNAESVLQYLTRYLWNAGARVYTARERCLNPNMVIVDDADPGFSLTGPWSNEYIPGAYNGRTHLVQTNDSGTTATATFTPDIPESGYYGVYAWYRPVERKPGPEMITTHDALIRINHTGGSTIWIQDQNRDGHTWKFMGDYYFEKGTNPETGSVVIENRSDLAGNWIVADAIRFGGGMGDTMIKGEISGAPRWEESGMFYTRFLGYDPGQDSRPFGSVTAMPMWAEWEAEEWEKGKAVYVSWHTNASGGDSKARGLTSFVYGLDDWSKDLTTFRGFPGGVELVTVVHDEIMQDVHAAWDPEWKDGGKVTRWLGETNPRNNNKMPAALFEYGFHDNAEDAKYILDPNFRNIVARATYKGIVKFFADHMEGFDNRTILPGPPSALSVSSRDGNVLVRWRAPEFTEGDGYLGHSATSYKVYYSRNGKGFDNGTHINTTEHVVQGLEAGRPHFFRVTALNAGGESLPTETLAVAPPREESETLLLVNGFDRLDRELNLTQPNGARRGILRHMNTFDYSIQHGEAIASAGYGFDSVSREAFTTAPLSLQEYPAMVWILGQQKDDFDTFASYERQAVREYLRKGGALLVSGSEVANDLNEKAPGFLRDQLRARLASKDAESWTVNEREEGIFSGIGRFTIANDKEGVSPVQAPDVLEPNAAEVALEYENGRPAAIHTDDPHRIVFLAFPFEAINEPEARQGIMERALEYLIQ